MIDFEFRLLDDDRLADPGAVYTEIFFHSGSGFVRVYLRGLLLTEVGYGNQESKQISPRFCEYIDRGWVYSVATPIVSPVDINGTVTFPMYHA